MSEALTLNYSGGFLQVSPCGFRANVDNAALIPFAQLFVALVAHSLDRSMGHNCRRFLPTNLPRFFVRKASPGWATPVRHSFWRLDIAWTFVGSVLASLISFSLFWREQAPLSSSLSLFPFLYLSLASLFPACLRAFLPPVSRLPLSSPASLVSPERQFSSPGQRQELLPSLGAWFLLPVCLPWPLWAPLLRLHLRGPLGVPGAPEPLQAVAEL